MVNTHLTNDSGPIRLYNEAGKFLSSSDTVTILVCVTTLYDIDTTMTLTNDVVYFPEFIFTVRHYRTAPPGEEKIR